MTLQSILAYFDQTPAGDVDCRLHFDDRGAQGIFGELRLNSAFQPLLAADSLRPMAYEALLRASLDNGDAIPPVEAINRAGAFEEVAYLDRLCRTVHVLNFMLQDPGADLYLNVDGRLLMQVESGQHGVVFQNLLNAAGIESKRVIIEIIESRIGDEEHLGAAVSAYQQRGYRVAVDDFGCQHSNFDRLWRMTPNIVKLDRSMIVEAEHNRRTRIILPKLVELIHDLGAQVVCEGIENMVQHQLAVDAGADLLQGYLYARPCRELLQPGWAWHGEELPSVPLPYSSNKLQHEAALQAA